MQAGTRRGAWAGGVGLAGVTGAETVAEAPAICCGRGRANPAHPWWLYGCRAATLMRYPDGCRCGRSIHSTGMRCHSGWSLIPDMPHRDVTPRSDAGPIARVAKVLAHPAHVRIIWYLLSRPGCSGGAFLDQVGLAQSTVPEHLRFLKAPALVVGAIERHRIRDALVSCGTDDPIPAAMPHPDRKGVPVRAQHSVNNTQSGTIGLGRSPGW